MYPSGRLARSTTSDYETKWWLDGEVEEKPGVTPADDHLAKLPVKTHIFSREEMEAFAEEKLPSQRLTKARRKNVPSRSLTKARLTTTIQTKIISTKTHARLDLPILPVDSGHPVSLLS
jgi:hypothetical protein